MKQIERLVEELTRLGFKATLWQKHGKLRVYATGRLGKKMAKDGKVFFDYPDAEDQAMALEDADGSLDVLNGTVCKVWHPVPTVSRWAWEEMQAVCEDLQDVKA